MKQLLKLMIMKAEKIKGLGEKISMGIFAILMMFSVELYGKKHEFLISSTQPAARGTVKITKDKNSNYNIKVEIFGLAEVSRLQPAKHTYVVWMVTDNETNKNIGQLKSSTSLTSKALKANLETVSTIKPIKIFITAEDDGSIQDTGAQTVLSTDKF